MDVPKVCSIFLNEIGMIFWKAKSVDSDAPLVTDTLNCMFGEPSLPFLLMKLLANSLSRFAIGEETQASNFIIDDKAESRVGIAVRFKQSAGSRLASGDASAEANDFAVIECGKFWNNQRTFVRPR